MALWRNSTFSPLSVLIKPVPIVLLNHLTVPFDMVLYLLTIESPHANAFNEEAAEPFDCMHKTAGNS
jgi:hypothetical protein